MSAIKPVLPPRRKGVQEAPKLPVKPPILPLSTKPTQRLETISSKPVLPPRVPLRHNGPSLPSRNKTTVTTNEQKYCGRQAVPKYEQRDYSIVDEYVGALPEYASIRELSSALTCNFPDIVDKYRAIFCWLAFNVIYDADSFLAGDIPPQSAENTFRSKLAVCAGYAMLFQTLCDFNDLQCIHISGYAKGAGFDPAKPLLKGSNHAWNAICLNDEWYMIDSTWGAGYLCGTKFHPKFNPFYFLANPEEFIYQHMPMEDDRQFTAARFTWEQYAALNTLDATFFRSGAQLMNHIDCASTLRPQQGQEIEIQLLVPKDLTLMVALDSDAQNHKGLIQMERSRRPGFLLARCTVRVCSAGRSQLMIYARNATDADSGVYGSFLGYAVEATPGLTNQKIPAYPLSYVPANSYTIMAPLISPLQSGTVYHIVIKDVSDEARTQPKSLTLWQSRPGPEFTWKEVNGDVLYEIMYDVRECGTLNVGERHGQRSVAIATWDVD